MDTRALNTMNHTQGKITRTQFLFFEKIRRSGKRNMFGFDTDIQRGDNYSQCKKWFMEKNQESELTIDLNNGLVQLPLIEREDGTIWDPMTGHTVFEKGELE